MFPFPVAMIGVSDKIAPFVRQELAHISASVEGEYSESNTAIQGLGSSQNGKKLLIVHLGASEDSREIRALAEKFRGWPILALVESPERENLLRANRAGAMQVVPVPLQHSDLYAALACLALQYRTATPDCRVIAFTGSAAGCGTTTLATNVAYEIAFRLKEQTVLVELAPQMGVIATNLDVKPTCTLADLVADGEQLDAQLVQQSLVHVADNFDILPGSQGVGQAKALSMPRVLQVLDYIRPISKYIVLDVPCTYSDFQFEILGTAADIVLVGEQSISSIRTLKMVLEALRPGPSPHTFHVVINRYDPKMEGLTAAALRKTLDFPQIFAIPDDRPGVLLAMNEEVSAPSDSMLTGCGGRRYACR